MRKFLSLLLALVMVLCCIPAVAETADGVYEGTGAGLNGQIKVSVTVSGGKITEVKVLEHSETAGISDPAIEKIPAAIVEAVCGRGHRFRRDLSLQGHHRRGEERPEPRCGGRSRYAL